MDPGFPVHPVRKYTNSNSIDTNVNDKLQACGKGRGREWKVKVSLPSANDVWGKVMFSHLLVILFGGRGGFPACTTGHMTGGSSDSRGRAVCLQGDLHPGADLPLSILWDMINKRVVHLLLECILVIYNNRSVLVHINKF